MSNICTGHKYKMPQLKIGITKKYFSSFENFSEKDYSFKTSKFQSLIEKFKNDKQVFLIIEKTSKDKCSLYLDGNLYVLHIDKQDCIFTIADKIEIKRYEINKKLSEDSLIIIPNNLTLTYDGLSKTISNPFYVNETYKELKSFDDLAKKIESIKETIKNIEPTENRKKLDKQLEYFLTEVKKINNADKEFEETEVTNKNEDNNRKIIYAGFEETENSKNQNKISYRFKCEPFETDELEKYPVFTVPGINDQKIDGRFEGFTEDNENIYVELSFKEVNKSEIKKHGQIEYKFLPIQHNIRNEAIDKILNNVYHPLNKVYNKLDPIVVNSDKTAGISINDLISPDKEGKKPNNSQAEAIKKGSSLDNSVLLVLGPPGTGKTTVIVKWIIYYVSRGKRVLISSQSNMAVDNALEGALDKEKVGALGRDIECLRVGNNKKISDKIKEVHLLEKRSSFQNKIKNNCSSNTKQYKEILKKLSEWIHFFEKRKENFNKILLYIDKSQKKSISTRTISKINSLNKELFEITIENEYLENKLSRQTPFSKVIFFFRNLHWKNIVKINKRRYNKLEDDLNDKIKKFKDKVSKKANIKKQFDFLFGNSRKVNELSSIKSFLSESVALYLNIKEFETVCKKYNYNFDENLFTLKNQINAQIDFYKDLIELFNKYIKNLNCLFSVVNDYTDYLDKHIEDFNDLLFDCVDVVGATCIGINSNKEFKNTDFDVVIVDEGGQILSQDVVVPLSKAKENIIMVGDHLQIPPIANEKLLKDYQDESQIIITKSYFEILYNKLKYDYDQLTIKDVNKKHTVELNEQYRMPSSISNLISTHFYAGNYKAADFKDKYDEVKPLCGFKSNFMLYDIGNKLDSYEKKGENGGYYNEKEVKVIVYLFEKIIKGLNYNFYDNKGNFRIGIITAYKAQVCKIKDAIREVIRKEPRIENINVDDILNQMINSLDSFQGQERDIIIYSFVRSNSNGKIGFLKESRRINVALTRTKKQLICIGNFEILSSKSDSKETEHFTKFLSLIYNESKNNAGNHNQVCRVKWEDVKNG